jgi:hypothetical protein
VPTTYTMHHIFNSPPPNYPHASTCILGSYSHEILLKDSQHYTLHKYDKNKHLYITKLLRRYSLPILHSDSHDLCPLRTLCTVLGPLPFLLYISGLQEVISSPLKPSLLADDTGTITHCPDSDYFHNSIDDVFANPIIQHSSR